MYTMQMSAPKAFHMLVELLILTQCRPLCNTILTSLTHSLRTGRVLLGLFRNMITRNRQHSCSFRSFSVFGKNGISFRSFCSRQQSEQNERNRVYLEYAEYAFFWEMFGGKSNAAAGRRSPGFRLEDVVVLRSPPP